MKRTYYFDNSERVFRNKLVVVGETAFRKIKSDYSKPEWSHHWLSGDFDNLEQAKEYFKKEWFED